MGQSNDNTGGRIGGISLASFLQMLEQERKTCILVVESENRSGRLYFNEGDLIDAECGEDVGQEAVYSLLTWEGPSFRVTEGEDRLQRITLPLAHILLQAATRQDELQADKERKVQPPTSAGPLETAAIRNNPALRRLVETIVSIPEVRHYYLLNRQGKMITQSSKNTKMPDFITYSVVSGIQIRKALQVKGPHRIQLNLENGDMLLVFPGAGMIIGLQLDGKASVSAVTAKLRPILTRQSSSPV
ncbi:MAG TPA: DUF4388 domain-containing protein [Desulfobulbaceae bacterium]|nr:DUF4388 domain-containing protein [Desulfobulbaceae bacterium]